MDIMIKDSAAAESLLANYKTEWTLRNSRWKNKLAFYYICSLAIIVFVPLKIIIKDRNEIVGEFGFINVDTILFSFGIALLIITVNWHLSIFKQNKLNLAHLNKMAELVRKGENTMTLRVSEELVFIDYYSYSLQLSWEYFNHYSVYKNLIFLRFNKSLIENIVINKDLISEEEYQEILAFVSEKLERHKF